jgi:hypothetical protein
MIRQIKYNLQQYNVQEPGILRIPALIVNITIQHYPFPRESYQHAPPHRNDVNVTLYYTTIHYSVNYSIKSFT